MPSQDSLVSECLWCQVVQTCVQTIKKTSVLLRLYDLMKCWWSWLPRGPSFPFVWTHIVQSLLLGIYGQWCPSLYLVLSCLVLSALSVLRDMWHSYVFLRTLSSAWPPQTAFTCLNSTPETPHPHACYFHYIHHHGKCGGGNVKLNLSSVKDSDFRDFFLNKLVKHSTWNDIANKAFRAVKASFTTSTIFKYTNLSSSFYSYWMFLDGSRTWCSIIAA